MAALSDAEIKMRVGGAKGGKWVLFLSLAFHFGLLAWGVAIAFDLI